MNFDGKKGKIAYNYLLQDKATISLDKHGSWFISVTNTTIKSLPEYYRQLDETANKVKKAPQSNIDKLPPIYFDDYTERKLKSGDNYNPTDMSLLFQNISKNLMVSNKIIITHALIKIDTNGNIGKMIFYNSNGLSAANRDSIVSELLHKKTLPFIQGNRRFESYKNLSLTFIPPGDTQIKIMDEGTLDGNPYLSYESINHEHRPEAIPPSKPLNSQNSNVDKIVIPFSKPIQELIDSIQNDKPRYNPANIGNLIKPVKDMPVSKKVKFFQCKLLVNIDKEGSIISVKPYDLSDDLTAPEIVKRISETLIGKKMAPVVLKGRYYLSYKSYFVMFWPPNIPKMRISENQTLFNN